MLLRLNGRLALAGLVALLASAAIGCGPPGPDTMLADGGTPPDLPPPDGGTPPPPDEETPPARTYAAPFKNTNARSAFIVTEDVEYGISADIGSKKTKLGQATATITRDRSAAPQTLGYDLDTTDISSMQATETGIGQYIIGYADGNLSLTEIPDADGDGVIDDSFLVLTEHNPLESKTTEFSTAYVGQRTPTTFLEPLAQNDHKATYTGTAFVLGGIGGGTFDDTGTLSMTASFGNTGADAIKGKISDITNAADDFDNLTFTGQLTSDLNDFGIKNIMLNKGDTAITAPGTSAGIGSFVGSKAGGTMGAFSSSQTLLDGTTPVNVIGHFHGTTTDNN